MGRQTFDPKVHAPKQRELGRKVQAERSKRRRVVWLEEFKKDPNALIDDVCEAAGVTRHTYRSWRARFPDFKAEVDRIKAQGDGDILTLGYSAGFAKFRSEYFATDTPAFQMRVIDILERGNPGEITLILLPPEHGKTTLLEDYCNYKLAVEPNYRIIYGSEGTNHTRKVIRRVKSRMEAHGPFPEYVSRFGPFTPGDISKRKTPQPWAQDYFDVYKKGESDERDYSMVGLGLTSAIAGTRCDLMVIDDIQSLKSIGQTEKMIEIVRQDWFSRPGSKGRIVFIGTRVGDEDVYNELIDNELIDNLVKIPAIDGDGQYLWPERYSPDEYARMKRNVGPAAWARNYQQAPTVAGEQTFTEAMVEQVANPVRATWQDPPYEVNLAVLGLDPGFGVNALMAAGMTEHTMYLLDWRTDRGLTSNQAIFDVVGSMAWNYHNRGTVEISDLAIEDKAFQKGLFDDEGLKILKRDFGFRVHGHQTGINKYDENIGIPSMARSFIRGEIDIPASDDDETQRKFEELKSELVRWRPHKKGTKLQQDLVMALWFCWLIWRQRRHTLGDYRRADASAFQTKGLAHSMRPSGLLLPTGS